MNLQGNPGLDGGVTATYTLTVECADDWGSTTGNVLVNVQSNMPPVINSLPTTVSVEEGEKLERKIHSLLVTEPDGEDYTCRSTGVIPVSSSFVVRYDSLVPGKIICLCYYLIIACYHSKKSAAILA